MNFFLYDDFIFIDLIEFLLETIFLSNVSLLVGQNQLLNGKNMEMYYLRSEVKFRIVRFIYIIYVWRIVGHIYVDRRV
jgi:hypothetical protein